jgi:hypothetical protein
VARRGFVLAAVLYALVLLAALSAAGFFAALQEARIGRNRAALLRVQAAAASAMSETIAGWDPLSFNAIPAGTAIAPGATSAPGVALSVEVRRLSDRLYLLRTTARDSGGGAGRTLEQVVRLRGLDVVPRAAVRARSADSVAAAALSGADQNPAGWDCPATHDTVTALMAQPSATDSVFYRFGDRDWASVTAWAVAVGGGSDSIEVRLAAGDLMLSGVRYLGVLIVNGNLTMSGGTEVVGIVLVRGWVRLEGAGGTVRGSVVASQLIAGQGYTPAAPAVVYSSCAVLRAGLAHAYPEGLVGFPPWSVF